MSLVEQLQDHAGWLRLSLLTIEALEPEQHLVFSAIDDDGNSLHEETCERLFMIAGEIGKERNVPQNVQTLLDDQFEAAKAKIVQDVTKRNQGIHVKRDSWVSVMYAEELNSGQSSVTLQRTDRHGSMGQKSADFQLSL